MDARASKTELRILFLEDVPTDAELAEMALREAGLEFVSRRVDKRKTFVQALSEFNPDIVLADFKLPSFDGGAAVKIVREQYPAIPVVMVTGAIGDEKAVELLMLGAKDYVLKDRLARLGPAVKRALSEERGIRARKTAEKALRESEARYRRITEGLTDYQYTVRIENGRAVETTQSAACVTVTGYTADEFAANPYLWIQMVPPEDRELVTQHAREILAGTDVPPLEHRIIRKDGEMRWVSDTTILFKDASGKLLSYDGVIKDITERRTLEDALKETANRNQTIMETANEAIISMRPDGVIHLWNRKAQEIFGYTAQEAIGQKMHELITPDYYRGAQNEGLRQFARTGAGPIVGKTLELTALRKAGAEFPVELSVSAMNIRGEWHATGIIRDITERKKAEARIQKLTRLYATLSQTNQTIVRTTNRDDLFSRVCESAVINGKFVMAWVGLVDKSTGLVRPVCHYGVDDGYLDHIIISVDDEPKGRGPTGIAVRENCVSFVNDFATDERALPWREAALQRGFKGASGVPLRFKGRPIGALTLYADETNFFDAEQLGLLEEMATDISFALDGFEREALRQKAEEERGVALQKLRKALENSIRVAASISEVRDPYTSGHQQRVSQLAVAIAGEMGLSAAQIDGIHFGGLIHDIGKIGVPAEILSKPSKLTALEMKLIQTHPQAGSDVIKDIEFPWPVAQMILQHHERLNGSGYPVGLKGDEIIIEAKIIAVADTVEAMWSSRPYRPGLGMDAALKEIAGGSGIRYDKQAVDACQRLIREKGFAFKTE